MNGSRCPPPAVPGDADWEVVCLPLGGVPVERRLLRMNYGRQPLLELDADYVATVPWPR